MTTKTDTFPTTGNPVPGNWATAVQAALQVFSIGAVKPTSATFLDNGSYWLGSNYAFANDQTSKITFTGIDSFDWAGAAVRCASTGATGTGYVAYAQQEGPQISLYKIVAGATGSGTVLHTAWTVASMATGTHTLELDVAGTTLTVILDGVTVGTVTDSTYASGQPGMFMTAQNTGSTSITSYTATDAAGGAFSLVCANGAYALTGEPATMLQNRFNIVAANGAYALTGEPAVFLAGANLIAAAGSYAITGEPVTMTAAFKLTAAGGSYSLTGEAANFLAGFVLAAAPGAYALAGQAAQLATSNQAYYLMAAAGTFDYFGAQATSALQIDAANAAYAFTGQPTALVPSTFGLHGDVGIYAMTGEAVTLTQAAGGYSLSLAGGSYGLTGEPVNAGQGANTTIFAFTGVYNLLGSDAIIAPGTNAFQMLAMPGAYDWTGAPALSALQLDVATGTYTQTGESVTFTAPSIAYSLVCANGTYVLTGTDQNSALVMPVDGGLYALNGLNATFVAPQDFDLSLDTGTYTLTGVPAQFNSSIAIVIFGDRIIANKIIGRFVQRS